MHISKSSSNSKFITYFFAILILFVTSCDALKPAQKTDTGDKNEELDPIVGKNKDRDKEDSNTDNSNSNNNAIILSIMKIVIVLMTV